MTPYRAFPVAPTVFGFGGGAKTLRQSIACIVALVAPIVCGASDARAAQGANAPIVGIDKLQSRLRGANASVHDVKQNPAKIARVTDDPTVDAGAGQARGISVNASGTDGGLTIIPVDDPPFASGDGASDEPSKGKLKATDAASLSSKSAQKSVVGPIRIASRDGQTAWFPELQRQQPVVLVDARADPDLIWDAASREVLAGPDVVARNISVTDLPGVIDQALVLAWLKQQTTRANQPIRIRASDEVHTRGARIEIEVGQLTNRFLVLFNISGNGAVQLLYPVGSDPPQRVDPNYNVTFQIREPFGADHIVAITSSAAMPELERTLRVSSRRLNADRLAAACEKIDARIGYVGLLTTP